MTNDVEVTKINAALVIVTYNGGQTIDTELLALSVDFLSPNRNRPRHLPSRRVIPTTLSRGVKRFDPAVPPGCRTPYSVHAQPVTKNHAFSPLHRR